MYRHFPLLGPFFLLTIHLLFSQQCHPIYYTADLNDHLLVEGAPQKGMYGSIVIKGNVGQHWIGKSIVDKVGVLWEKMELVIFTKI